MCKPASGILTRYTVLWCKGNSHEVIIEENKLDDTAETPDFVRFEISPPDNDFGLPFSKWQYQVDQDILPKWYKPARAKRRVLDALPEWYNTHVFSGGEHDCVEGMEITVYGNAVINQSGGVCWNVYGNAVVNQSGGECWNVYGNAVVNQSGGVCWDIRDNAVINQSGGVCWNVYGNAVVNQSGGECRNIRSNAVINQSGGECWDVYSNAVINQSGGECWDVYGNAVINHLTEE